MLGDPLPQQLCLLCSHLDIGSLGLYICPRSGSLQSAGQTKHTPSVYFTCQVTSLETTNDNISQLKKKKNGNANASAKINTEYEQLNHFAVTP